MADEEDKVKQEAETKDQKPEKSEDNEKEASEAKSSTKEKSGAAIPTKFKKLVEEIETLSVLELSELVKALEDRLGVSAAAPAAVAAAPAAGGAGEAAADEKSEYTVVLKDGGAQKINVIKAVREISGLGLAESKGVVDSAPKPVLEKVKKEEAEEAKKKLEEAGATVELE